MKTLLAFTAIIFALALASPASAFSPFNGYTLAVHTGNTCAAAYVSPSLTSTAGGAWFSIDISATTTLTPQAVTANVAAIQSAATNTELLSLFGFAPANIPQLRLDFDPTHTVICNIDAEGDGQIVAYPAKNFNYPKVFAPQQ